MDPIFFPTPDAFDRWLAEHHATARELWIGFHRKDAGRGGLTYAEAVDAALCWGWIDGVRRKLDDTRYANRFTPRKASSNWSAVNVRRVAELTALGRMRPPGLAAYEARDEARTERYSYEGRTRGFDDAFARRFQADGAAWAWFEGQAPYYRRQAAWWVMSAKREETRERRFAALLACSARGERLPQFARP